MITLDYKSVARERDLALAKHLIETCGDQERLLLSIAEALAVTRSETVSAMAHLDVYMTEDEHGDLDMADGSSCFDAAVRAYRRKITSYLSSDVEAKDG